MIDTPQKPDIEEHYSVAVSAANLKVETIKRGPADMLIAAGWSRSRIGQSLLRLHTEWSAAEHPRRSKEVGKELAEAWHIHETKLLLQKLKTLPEVRHQLGLQMGRWRYEDGQDKAAAVLMWWLDQNCKTCQGTKLGPTGHGSMCKACRGSGKANVPHGQEGKRLANWIDTCIELAKGSIGIRLRASMKRS